MAMEKYHSHWPKLVCTTALRPWARYSSGSHGRGTGRQQALHGPSPHYVLQKKIYDNDEDEMMM